MGKVTEGIARICLKICHFMVEVTQAGVKYLDYASFIDWPHQELTQADGAQPTAQGHRLIAAQLVQDLGRADGEGEQ